MNSVDRQYESDDITMVYADTGQDPRPVPGERERVFVLVHGIGMGRIVYQDVAPILATRGRVIALDLPGFGDSPEPGSATTIAQTAENLANFLRAEGLAPAILVGHSMGTQVVAELAATEPALVEGLVLIAPTINRWERKATTQALRMFQDMWGEGFKVLAIGVYEYFKTNPLWYFRKLAVMLEHRIEQTCAQVQVPTLVLYGETDRICPKPWADEVTQALPIAMAHPIPGRGHEAIIKSPEPVATMILEYVNTLPTVR